jgi:hypothetical protein
MNSRTGRLFRKFVNTRARRISTLALVFTLVLQLYLPGAALCLENDSSASIEDYLSGDCADSFADSNTGSLTPPSLGGKNYPGEGHCGPCLDIPLAEGIGKRDTHSGCNAGQDMHMRIFAAYVSPVSLYLQSPYKKSFMEVTPRRGPLPGFRQSVILIC